MEDSGVAKIRSILDDSLNEAVAYQGHRQRADAEAAYATLDRMVAKIAELEQQLAAANLRAGQAVAEFIDNHSVTCDCCQHVLIDVTAAKTGGKNHCVAGDPEGEGSACASGWREASESNRLDAEQAVKLGLRWMEKAQALEAELAAANLRAGQAEWTRNLAQAASTRDVEAKRLVERERDAARKHLTDAVDALRIFAENQPVMEAIDCAFATVTRSSVDKAAAVVLRFDVLRWKP